MAHNETIEAMAAEIHELLARSLRDALKRGEITSMDKRLALDLIKYNKVSDGSPFSTVRDLAKELEDKIPFESLDQEIL